MKQRKYTWWHGALLLVGITVLGSLSAGARSKTRKTYKQRDQAPWAPPAWVFGPAWIINNAFLIWGLLRILNNGDMPNRRKLLLLQGLHWIDFLSFGYVYFKKDSPILAEIWTQSDALLATQSFRTALQSDKKLPIAYLPLMVWTWFASSLSAYQALKNPDPVFETEAVIE